MYLLRVVVLIVLSYFLVSLSFLFGFIAVTIENNWGVSGVEVDLAWLDQNLDYPSDPDGKLTQQIQSVGLMLSWIPWFVFPWLCWKFALKDILPLLFFPILMLILSSTFLEALNQVVLILSLVLGGYLRVYLHKGNPPINKNIRGQNEPPPF